MGVVQDLVTELRTEGGFEITEATALTVLDRRHKQMCARALWHRLVKTAVVATSADSPYSSIVMPTGSVEVFTISVPFEEDGPQFTRTARSDRGAMMDGTLKIRGRGGVFVEAAGVSETDTTPDTTLILYPAVTVGLDAFLEGAWEPPTLLIAETAGAFVRVPPDFYEGLLAGCYASLLNRPGESRPDLAAVQEQAFTAACAELLERAKRRYRAVGPRQIRVQGQTV